MTLDRLAVAIQRDPIKWCGRQKGFQAQLRWFGKALPKKLARIGSTRRIGQGGGNMANQTGILLADTDFHPNDAIARFSRTMTNKRRLGPTGHSQSRGYFRKRYRKSSEIANLMDSANRSDLQPCPAPLHAST